MLFARSRAVPGLLVLLGITALVPIWLADPPPLQDLPNHLLKVDLFRRYLTGDAGVRSLFALDLGPIPNSFCYAALLVLSQWMTLLTAAKIYLSAAILGLLAVGFVWVQRHNPENLLLALAPAGLAYTMFTTKGFLNFIAAEPMYLGCLLLISRRDFRKQDAFALGALAVVLFETHGFVFLAMLGAAGAFLVLAATDWGSALRRTVPLLPALGLLGVWTWRSTGLPSGGEPPNTVAWPLFVHPFAHLQEAYVWLFGKGPWSGFGGLWLLGVAIALGHTAFGLLHELTSGATLRAAARRHAFLLVALGMGLTYVAGPDLPERHAAVRWLPLTMLTLLAGLTVPRGRAAVGVLLVVAALGLHLGCAAAFVEGAADVREYLAGAAVMEPGASVLPIDRVDDLETDRINLHTWAYHEIDHGGWTPYVHAWPGRHPIYLRRRLWAPPESADVERERLPEEVVERVAACYDYVVLWDATDDGTAEFSRDFELAKVAPRLHVWRNRAGVRRRMPSSVPGCIVDDAEATHS